LGYRFYLFLRLFYWILKLLPQWHCFVFFFVLQHVFHVYWWYSKQNNNLNFANWFSVIYSKELDIKILQKQFHLTHFLTWISIMLYGVHLVWKGFEHTTLLVKGTDCTCCCKPYYHEIVTMTATRMSVIGTHNVSGDSHWYCFISCKCFIGIY
jgi:hypothetical protein